MEALRHRGGEAVHPNKGWRAQCLAGQSVEGMAMSLAVLGGHPANGRTERKKAERNVNKRMNEWPGVDINPELR